MKPLETGVIKKYWKPVLLSVFILVSIKPVVFTWHFIQASLTLHLEKDRFRAGTAIADTVSYRPSTHVIFNRTSPQVLEDYLARTAVYADQRELLDEGLAVIDPSRLRFVFKDNFYVQNLLGGLDQQREWQYLDDLSLYVLADKRMNHITIAILEKIAARLEREFLKNIANYCHWKGNTPLARYLVSSYALEDTPFKVESHGPVPGDPAIIYAFLNESYRLKAPDVGANLLQNPGFQEKPRWETKWYLSKMAGKKGFARGSFVMGSDHAEAAGKINRMVRLMGFYAEHAAGKNKPRAGVRCRRKFPAENGVYLFSFNYLTVSGKEDASFWLSSGLLEQRLPATAKQWKTVVFLLDNSSNTYTLLNPLIRMWGTGTLLVDNVFLAKILDPEFSISGDSAAAILGDAK